MRPRRLGTDKFGGARAGAAECSVLCAGWCDYLYLFVQLILQIYIYISGLSDQWRWPLLHYLLFYICFLLGQWENTD